MTRGSRPFIRCNGRRNPGRLARDAARGRDPDRCLPGRGPGPGEAGRRGASWIKVKHEYELTVDDDEREALEEMLGRC